MTEHYFSSEPAAKHKPQSFESLLLGQRLTFRTDAGVFSKRKLDRGTKLLLESLDLGSARKILDLGCGYGAIGLTVAKLAPGAEIWLSDVNRRAVELAEGNAALNGIGNCQFRAGYGLEPFAAIKFDLIITNPPVRTGKEVIYGLFAAAKGHLVKNGRLVLVMRTQQGAKSAQKKLAEIYPVVREIQRGGGFRVFECVNS